MSVIDWVTQSPEEISIKSIPLSIQEKYITDFLSPIFKIAPCYVAGGAARQLYFNKDFGSTDIDIFPNTLEGLDEITLYLADFDRNPIINEYAKSYKYSGKKIQIIEKYGNNLTEILFDFDFTVCCFAFDTENMYFTDEGKQDSLLKRLRLNGNYFKVYRVFKYMAKGFIPEEKILTALNKELGHIFGSANYSSSEIKEMVNNRIWIE